MESSDDEEWFPNPGIQPTEPECSTCSRPKCNRPPRIGGKTCTHHYEYNKAWHDTPKGKESTRKKNQKQKLNGNVSKYWKGEKGKALAHKEYLKKKADPGKLLMLRIGTRITQSLHDTSNFESTRLKTFTEFENSDDVQSHFESMWEPWMNWNNYGVHVLTEPRRWNVGHRIPLTFYNANDPEDFRRCWKKCNLYPQDARENNELKHAMPSVDVLMPLKHNWPLAWGDSLPGSVN
jgi:hypothetical protein